jgi:hypothetical protein
MGAKDIKKPLPALPKREGDVVSEENWSRAKFFMIYPEEKHI